MVSRCRATMAARSAIIGRLISERWTARSRVNRWARVRRPRVSTVRRPFTSSWRSGTMALAAWVGVEARRSATKSNSGLSLSWPMALTTGVRHPDTALISASLLNGNRSSKEPPPRAITMTSTSGRVSNSLTALLTATTVSAPWTGTWRISKRAAGQRRCVLLRTSRSAAVLRPTINPIRLGRNGRARLRSVSNRPSERSSCFRCSKRARSSPTPMCRICRASSCRVPRLVQKLGLACTTTRDPGCGSAVIASNAGTGIVRDNDMSTSVSRRVTKAVFIPGRRLSCTI